MSASEILKVGNLRRSEIYKKGKERTKCHICEDVESTIHKCSIHFAFT